MTENMKRVARCESGMRTDAIGDGGHSIGLMQIHLPSHPSVTREQAVDPFFSIEWAYTKPPVIWTCARKLRISEW